MGSSKFIVDVEFNNGTKDSLVLLGRDVSEIIDYLVCMRTIKSWKQILRVSDKSKWIYDDQTATLDVLRSLRDEVVCESDIESFIVSNAREDESENIQRRVH